MNRAAAILLFCVSRLRAAAILLLCLTIVAELSILLFQRAETPAEAAPQQPGLPMPVYATPALLAAVSVVALPGGAQAWVANQGVWTFVPACPAVCDGTNTCRAAGSGDGGLGCWIRGSAGVPGAENVAAWYVDCSIGNDANLCTSPAAPCATLAEPFMRVGQQCFPPNSAPVFALAANCATTFASTSFTFTLCGQGGEIPSLVGFPYITAPLLTTGADGGPLGLFTLTSYTSWDGGAKQEGIACLVPTNDGGPTFNPSTMGPSQGYGLYDQDSGATLYCGDTIDAGAVGCCNTPGTYALNSFAQSAPNVGDTFKLFQLVQLGTFSASITFNGSTAPNFQNVQLGSGTHAIQSNAGPTAGFGPGLIFEGCIVNGLGLSPSTIAYSQGNAYVGGHVIVYGGFLTFASDLFYGSELEARSGGFILDESGANMLVAGGTSVIIGCSGDGMGYLENDGNLAVTEYATVGLHVCQGSNVLNTGSLWFKNSHASAPAINASAGGVFTYNSGHAPGLTGTVPSTAYSVGGTTYDAGAALPLVNTSSLAGIIVNQ